MNINRRLFNQYFITQDEVNSNAEKTQSIRKKVISLSKRMTDQGWKTHGDTFVEITNWIDVRENPTADYEKNKRWVNLPSQELVDYLNRLWELNTKSGSLLWSSINPAVRDEISDILMKLQSTSF